MESAHEMHEAADAFAAQRRAIRVKKIRDAANLTDEPGAEASPLARLVYLRRDLASVQILAEYIGNLMLLGKIHSAIINLKKYAESQSLDIGERSVDGP